MDLLETVKLYCRVDYDDDIEILKIMIETVLQEMNENIPDFDKDNMTARQQLLLMTSVKDLYDNREKFVGKTENLRVAVSSMLLKERFK